MNVTMASILAARRAEQKQGVFHPAEPNKFRQFCKLKGIHGKGKKKFRRAMRERERAKASAMNALVNEQTAGGLIRETDNPGSG